MNNVSEQKKQKKITIYAAIHEDVPKDVKDSIYADHFLPLVKELESFTDHKVSVVFGAGAPYSNFDYKGEDTMATLRKWELLGSKYLDAYRAEGFDTNDIRLVVLVARDRLTRNIEGAALVWPPYSAGRFAIASVNGYQVIGHEIGHLLGARHEDSEINYNGWWSESYMTPQRLELRSNSYTFSEANRKNINNYLATKS
jgi:hypothetical protein